MRLQSIEQSRTGKAAHKYMTRIGAVIPAAILAAAALTWILSAFSLSRGEGGITGSSFAEGFIKAWNGIADALGNSDYVLLPRYEGAGDGMDIFLLLTGIILTVGGYGVIRSRKAWMLLIYLIPYFAVQLLWDVQPSAASSVFFLGTVFGAALCCLYPHGGSLMPICLLLIPALAAAGCGLLLQEDTYQKIPAAQAAENTIREAVHQFRYGTDPRGCGSLAPEGFDSEETALEVTMEHPDSLYLKGFTGAAYTEGRWERLSDSDAYTQIPLFYWLHQNEFSGLTQLYRTARMAGEEPETGTVQITVRNAGREYLYLPYELAGTLPEGKNRADSFLTAEGFRGADTYTFTVSDNLVERWPALCASLFSMEETQELEDYLLNESHYNVQMYEDYTALTKQQRKELAEYIGSSGDQTKGHVDYKEAIYRVRGYLEENFIYTQRVKTADDPIMEFFETRKGCDVHYASAATLMFRYYGIPARYAEGYIITPEAAEEAGPGETITIPLSANHAWTEIYIDGSGWVPLEVTPEYYDIMKQPDLSKGLENLKGSESFDENRRTIQQAEEGTTSVSETRKGRGILLKLLLLAAGILLLLLLIRVMTAMIRKLMKVRRRKRAFRQPDVKKAVCAIYGYMLKQNWQISEEVRRIGERAAFSPHPAAEEERSTMLAELERMKKENHEKKDRRHDRSHTAAGRHHRLRRDRG